MELNLAETWQERFGSLPPKWVDRFVSPQDVDGCISECEKRLSELRDKLEQQLFILTWLQDLRKREASNQVVPVQLPPLSEIVTKEQVIDSPVCLRRRAFDQVDVSDILVAKRVGLKVKQTNKYLSTINIESLVEQSSEHLPLNRQRSMSDSVVQKPHMSLTEERQSPVLDKLSPIPDVSPENQPSNQHNDLTQVDQHNDLTQVDQHQNEPDSNKLSFMKAPETDMKRLSNGIHESVSDHSDDEDSDLLASVKTIIRSVPTVSPNELNVDYNITDGTDGHDGAGNSWMECSGTLKQGMLGFPTPHDSGEKTPTGSLDTYVDALEKGITINMINEVRSCSLDEGLDLREAMLKYRNVDDDDDDKESDMEDDQEEEERLRNNEDSGSVNEFENSGYHTYSNLAESTLTYILRDTIFASRSSSVSSLSGPDIFSPELTPSHEVNLRPNTGKRKDRNRTTQERNRTNRAAKVLREFGSNDDITDEDKLQKMLADLQDSGPSSPSSELSSEPSSPTHLQYVKPTLSARSSCIYSMRQNTIVGHGEVLVIRKLVVAGIVTAEKAYLDCLYVAKEHYRKPLLAITCSTQPILTENDINTIFYRVEDLHDLHAKLHSKLEALVQSWTRHSCVGNFFKELCLNLMLYKDYVEMYRRSLECLERSKQDPSFKKFLEDVRSTVQTQYKDVPNVNELLRKPVERLQSYSLVLTDLCQHTPESHDDISVLKQSLKAMSDFIASTHNPKAFQQLSGGFNRELVKQELVVELVEGSRKIRRLFLFHDVLISAKEKSARHGKGIKLESKWFLPLHNLRFHPPGLEALRPVPVTSEHEMSIIKSKLAELKAQLNRGGKERKGSTLDKDASFKRNFKAQIFSNKEVKLRKRVQEQQVAYWVASPSLPLRLYGSNGKRYVFLLHNEEERESWISAMKKLQPKAETISLSQLEVQDLLSRQKIQLTRDQEEVIEVQTDEEEYLSGILSVRVTSATHLKAKQVGLFCGLELDEYGRFDRKARTRPAVTDPSTLTTIWDHDFELEIVGAHIIKVVIFSKSLLKEEVCASGKIKIPIKDLKSSKRCKLDVKLHPHGYMTIVLEYFASIALVGKRPGMISTGVFGFPMDKVARREKHYIPLIVQTCVDEVEKRGLEEVGVYRVAGVLRDVKDLRDAFDTDYLQAQSLAAETDIHAVAGLLKRYFRELPDPLFTDELYCNFVQALGLVDPEARGQSLVALFHSLPIVHFKTAVYLFRHLRNVAANAEYNKMTLNNLATVFGPNLFRPGITEDSPPNIAAAFDIMSPVNTLMFFLTCPEEVYDEISPGSTPNSFSKGSSKKQFGHEEDATSISSAQSSGFTTSLVVPTSPVGVSSSTSSPTPLFNPPSSHASTTPTTVATTTPTSGPIRYKQSEI